MQKFFRAVSLFIILPLCLSACGNLTERQKATTEKVTGNAQETLGNITNDSELKHKGKVNRTKGNLRATKEDVKDLVTGN